MVFAESVPSEAKARRPGVFEAHADVKVRS